MYESESFALRRLYPGNTQHKNQFYSISLLKSRKKCKKKYPQGQYSLLPENFSLFTSVYGITTPAPVFNIPCDTAVTIDLPIYPSLLINSPAAHGLDVRGLTLINRIKDSAVDWTSTHAALVSLNNGYAILTCTIHPGLHRKISSQGKAIFEIFFRMALGLSYAPEGYGYTNNGSHSKYMLPVSQRLNYPGNFLPPGLQSILHSSFVITGTIPPINIDRSLEQSRPEINFLFIRNLSAARGTKPIVQPLARMPIDFSPAPSGLKKKETQT